MATLKEQKARKDYKCSNCNNPIEKGDNYYSFSNSRFSPLKPRCLNCRPKQSEMTQSDFLSRVYSIQESIENLATDSDFESEIESFKGELEELQSECEDKQSNMPDNLQSSPVGQMLENRASSIGEMIDELDSIELTLDEEEIESDVKGDMETDLNKKFENFTKDEKTKFEERVEEEINEKKDEILGEIQNVSYNGE